MLSWWWHGIYLCLRLACCYLSFLLSTYQSGFLSLPGQWIKEEQSLQMWRPRSFRPRRHDRNNPTGSFKKEKQGRDEGGQEEKGKWEISEVLKLTAWSFVAWFMTTACQVLAVAPLDPNSQRVEMVAKAKHMLNFIVSKRDEAEHAL